MSQALDAEQWRELLARYHQVCGELVQAAEGHVAQYLGDGVLAYFGWPRANEDDAARAMRCALRIVRRLNELPPLAGKTLQARLGLDSGTVIVSAVGTAAMRENLVLGDIPNIAARVQSLAEPGTVLATERTWQLALGYFKGTSLGRLALKGVAQPPEVWRIEGETGARSRLEAAARLSPFVGRDLQLGQALAFVNDPQPSVRLLDVVGEPGIGKSRLLAELRLMLRHDPSILVLVGTCAPDRQGTPLSPFAEILRGMLGRAGHADSQAIGALLQRAGLDSTEHRGLLALLLGEAPPPGSLDALDSTLIGLRTRDLLLRLLIAAGQQRVTVVLFEDLHWLDAASQDVLARMAALQDPGAVRLVSTRRPEYQPPWQSAGGVQLLAMPPLSPQATAQIIVARFGESLLAELAAQLAVRAEGNALFAEELANYVAGAVQLSGEVPSAEALLRSMPDSVRSLLDARVDALTVDDQTLLHAAAVIGRRFDLALLAELVPSVAAVPERIERLITRDLLVRVGDGVCEFKHALTQDALYGHLLHAQAAQLHAAVARQFEKRYASDLDGVAEALAFHWAAADQPQQAVVALTRAGRKAWERYAIDDAQRHLEAAADLVEQAPDQFTPEVVLHMLRPLVHVLYGQNEPARTMRRVERHLGLVRAHLSQRDAVYVLAWYIAACCLAREYTAATQIVAVVWSAGAAQADPSASSAMLSFVSNQVAVCVEHSRR